MPPPAGKPRPRPAVYRCRRPERTLLYRLVQAHLATWLALHDDGQGRSAPALTEREFRRYLDCGILAHGSARARCADCGHDFIVAYSCKGRGVCPSCTTRRMAETAAHLVDHVFPRLPVRQWVLSFPKRLRYHLDDAELQNAVLHSVLHAIEQGLRQGLGDAQGEGKVRLGAVVFIHRFGALLNAHLHFHVVVIDGVFCGEDAETLRFEAVRLSQEALQRLQATIRQRIVRLFVRRGLLDKAEGDALCACEHGGGFSLDASVRIEANDRQGLERLLRYCARPAFAQERLRQTDAEHLVYESPKPGPGGRVSQILTPLELMDRLAALIPPPRRHRHRYYGALAPNSPLRPAVTALAAAPEPVPARADAVAEESSVSRAARYVWAMLLARIYEVFPLTCPKCGGEMRIIAFIDDPTEVKKILTHLGEPATPPLLAPARGPPLWEAALPSDADPFAQRQASTETQHLTRLWGPAYQSVAAADVVGERSNAGIFDEERGGDYGREAIGQGLAAAILLGSFGGQGGRSGFSSKDLKLACSKQGVNWNYADGALLDLEDRCFYLHTAGAGSPGKRYWFGTKPTLNKLVVQYRQQMARETFEEATLEDLRSEAEKGRLAGATWRVIVDPADDLPEQKCLTLLVLPPSLAWDENDGGNHAVEERVKAISMRCGRKDRLYRNTLLFLAGTARGLSKLRQAYRELAALEVLHADYWDQLDDEQREDLKKRLDAARKAPLEALGPAYTVVLRVRGQEVEAWALSDARRTFQGHLGYLWTTLVEDEEWILRRVGSVTLESTGLVPKEGALRLKDAVEAFLRFTDKPMIAAKEAVTAGLVQACADGLVGIGRGATLASLEARYCRQAVSLDPSEEGVWIIPPFTSEPADAQGGEEAAGTGVGAGDTGVAGRAGAGTTAVESAGTAAETKPGAQGTVRRVVVRGAVPVENWGELFRCFVRPAAQMNLKRLGLGVHFEMVLPEDRPLSENDPALKSMKEAARQLGLEVDIDESPVP